MKIKEVTDYLDGQFRPELQEAYDNSGLLVGDTEAEVKGVLVALDVVPEVVKEAVETGSNLIVSHHPLIFGGVKRITPESELGRMLYAIIKNDIVVYAAHTNLDNLPNGVNGALAKRLGLTNQKVLRPMTAEAGEGAGLIGELEEALPLKLFLEKVKEALWIQVLRCSSLCREEVKRVAICGGSGAFLIRDAIKAGVDAYITADIKYHDFQSAENRLVLVDVGHYESEQFVQELICDTILKKFSTFACRITKTNTNYINYI